MAALVFLCLHMKCYQLTVLFPRIEKFTRYKYEKTILHYKLSKS